MKGNLSEKGKVNSKKEKINSNSSGHKMLLSCLVVINVICSFWIFSHSQTNVQYEKLSDGIDHWYRIKPADEKPWFFQQLENIFDVVLARRDKLPFGKSVAFLIGVSDYKYLSPDLPFVKNDLKDLRQFLLDKGGFDEVYVASEKIVNRTLVEDYMRNKFPNWLKPEDRLLFYYSGHGDDMKNKQGFMQFSGARPNNFAGDQILLMGDITGWGDVIGTNHLLFILDCCASGLAINPKGPGSDEIERTIATLSRNGSRIIITAGTAEEQTYEVPRPGGKGNGVFTRAFLNALETGMTDKGKDGFLAIEEIFPVAKAEVTAFGIKYRKTLTPRWWQYDEGNYRGTFIFINPDARNQRIVLADNYANTIAATPRGTTIAEFGYLHLKAHESGSVYIDDTYADKIEAGEIKKYERSVGRHKIELKTASQIYAENVDILKGKTLQVTLGSVPITPIRQPEVKTAVNQKFRSTSKQLSEADVKAMLKQHKFYAKEYSWNKEFSNPDGVGFENQFTVQDDKVVIDNASGLMWQRGGSSEYMTYDQANEYIKQLKRDRFAGFDDWRLPTLEEAMSLMEPEQLNGDLYIGPKFDPTQRWIWTSDLYSSAGAWVVGFGSGGCGHGLFIDGVFYVRAVR